MEVMKHFLLIKIKHIYNFAYVRLMPLEEGWKWERWNHFYHITK